MEIFWIKLSKLYYKTFFETIKNSKEKISIFTPNPEILLAAKKDEKFKEILKGWDYLVPDGIWIWAWYQILDNRLPKFINFLLIPYYGLNLFIARKKLYKKYWWRIIWSILTKDLVEYANLKWIWVTIIDRLQPVGGKWEEKQKNIVKNLKNKYPKATFHFYVFDWNNLDRIIEEINNTEDIYLFSTQWLGDQEKTISKIIWDLKNIKVAIGVGGSFDYILWIKKRPPEIFVVLWLEWLWRLVLHPKRMASRIWKALPVFLYEVIKSKK